jgi:anti-sigma factor RsiW
VRLAAFERHLAACATCENLLRAARGVDRLLASWRTPETPRYADRVVRRLREIRDRALPTVTCEELRGEIHAFVDRSLEPPRSEQFEAHLVHCMPCADAVFDAEQARQLWLTWRVPDPPPHLAARVLSNLTLGGAASADQTSARPLRPGNGARIKAAPRGRRLATAAVLVGVGLLCFAIERRFPADPAGSRPVAEAPLEATHPAAPPAPVSVTAGALLLARSGSFDPVGAFAGEYRRPGRGRLFHQVRDW